MALLRKLLRNKDVLVRYVSFFSRKTKPLEEPFMILRATSNDANDIMDLMWDSYYPDEPTTAGIGLGSVRNCVFDDHTLKLISKGNSFVARCKYNGSISGVALNDITCPWDPDATEKLACSLACKRMAKLLMFYAYLQRVPDLWKKYCQHQIFEICNVVVKQEDRRKGLARRLMLSSRNSAADAGYKLIRVDATSVHTAAICERLKFKMVHEIPYCAYVGDDNEPIFKPLAPNNSVKVYVDTPHAFVK